MTAKEAKEKEDEGKNEETQEAGSVEKHGKKLKAEKRELVIPGEIIAKGDFLPGDWTIRQNEEIIAVRYGVADKSDKIVKVIPVSGVYIPRRGNVVIGEIKDITMRGWIVDISAPYEAFLTLKECPMFVSESDMESVFGVGDLVVATIFNVKRNAIDLTIRSRGLGKVSAGMIIKINPHRVPRVIGKEGSMISQIKLASGCEITVGQNGLVWLKGKTIDEELFAKKAIDFVVENTLSGGLTEKVEEWIKKHKKEVKNEEKKLEEEE